jgi:ERCC4-type nuclease
MRLRLSMGEYQIDNRLIVERKTLKDFVTIKRKASLETENQHE